MFADKSSKNGYDCQTIYLKSTRRANDIIEYCINEQYAMPVYINSNNRGYINNISVTNIQTVSLSDDLFKLPSDRPVLVEP